MSQPAQGLLAELKAADDRQRKMLRRATTLFSIATAAFVLVLVVMFLDPSAGGAARNQSMLQKGGLALIYLLVTGVYVIGLRRLARIDYAAPVRGFLKQAELRYRFMSPSDWTLSLLGLVVVGVISSIGSVPYLSRVFGYRDNPGPMYLYFIIFFILVAGMGLYFTWKNWKRDRAPLWRQIREAMKELGD